MMKKILLSIITITAFVFGANAQNVNIPDANFKTYLVGYTAINTNGDTEIQVSEATAFAGQINCSSLSISDLTGIEAFTALTHLECGGNSLSSLDVSNNTVLTILYCNYNSLTVLDVSNNTVLTNLNCGNNSLTVLDVSSNTALTFLACSYNQLSSLNVANGNNTNFNSFYAEVNPNLSCIQVDDVAYSTTSWTNIDVTASFSLNCSVTPCTVNIPDANFKAYLVGNTLINTNGDTEIQCSEATAFAGQINCQGLSISDLTGIEAFTALTDLFCRNNAITTLDLSQNTVLTTLDCRNNSITTLNISQNSILTSLDCGYNSLTALDVSSNTALTILKCLGNSLTNLNVSSNVNLLSLLCNSNVLTSLTLTQNINLTLLQCEYNQLTNLDVANGSNTNFTYFSADHNPNLTCIQVDNVAYSTTNWANIDAIASFSLNCSVTPCTVNIPDANFKAYLVGRVSLNTNGDTEIQCSEATAFTGYLDCSNLSISDLTGIEAFTALQVLYCYSNSLTVLDVSNNTSLIYLDCGNNSLTALDVSNNTSLTELRCYTNQLTALDVTNNTALTITWCYSNSLTALDVTNNTALTVLACDNNSLTALDVTNNTALTVLGCRNNSLTALDVSNNTALIQFDCQQNSLTALDVTNNTVLTQLTCSNNSLIALDVTNNTDLTALDCRNNSLTALDVTNNTVLITLACSDNSLTALDVANGNNTNLTYFEATTNPSLSCIQVDDVAYSTTNWTSFNFAFDAASSFSTNCGYVGIDELSNESLSIYPNPAKNELIINNGELKIEQISIIDVTGKIVKAIIGTVNTVNVSDLTRGIYFIQIQTEKGLVNSKFIKE